MAGSHSRKRKVEDGMKGKVSRPVKKFKKQTDYDNQSSESEQEQDQEQDFPAVNLQESDEEGLDTADLVTADISEAEDEPALDAVEEDSEVTDESNSDSNSDSDEANSNPNLIKKRKRNDPDAFATSMSKILGSKLSTSKRNDPVLSRSATAIQASKEMTDLALEKKVKAKLRDEKRTALDKGRVRDVLGASTAFDAANSKGEAGPSVQETMELEKRLRKTAQRGVVKLFNAVRAAQVKGEEAARDARNMGVVGKGHREEKITEMSKKGFLELIAGGGGGFGGQIEEA